MLADPSGELLGNAIARLKASKLKSSIDKRLVKNLVRVAIERAAHDRARFRLELVEGADFPERAVSRPFQLIVALPLEFPEIFAQRIPRLGARLSQIRESRSFVDPLRQQKDVAVPRQNETLRAHHVDGDHRRNSDDERENQTRRPCPDLIPLTGNENPQTKTQHDQARRDRDMTEMR
jgi:hypothetical protein